MWRVVSWCLPHVRRDWMRKWSIPERMQRDVAGILCSVCFFVSRWTVPEWVWRDLQWCLRYDLFINLRERAVPERMRRC